MTSKAVPDPTGDRRANLTARLEHDLMTWSERTHITYQEEDPDA